MLMIPTPERVTSSDRRWFVWFFVPHTNGRRVLHLTVVPR